MTDQADDRPMEPRGTRSVRRAGVLAGLLAFLAGSTFLIAADTRPAQAQFGISIGGFGMGGGFRGGGRPRMGMPSRGPGMGRMPSMNRMPSMRGGGMMGQGRMMNPGRMVGPGRVMDGGRMGRMDMPRGPRMSNYPGGRGPGSMNTYPGRRPGGGMAGNPDRYPGRPGAGRPGYPGGMAGRPDGYPPRPGRPDRPGGRPGYPGRPPVVVIPPYVPPVAVIPPGGGGRLPPGGPPMGPPPGGPGGFGPGFVGPAVAVPAFVSSARASNPQDIPGMPPAYETRYVPDEVLFLMRPGAPPSATQAVVRRFNLTMISEERSELLGTTVHRYRVPNRMTVPAAIRAMTRTNGVAYVQPNYVFERPNYVYRLQSSTTTQGGGASLQYVVDTLRLPEAHLLARGEQVPIAVIDSGIEATHPEMAGRIARSFDAVGGPFQAHEHGTGMAGAIVAHAQLTGISPRASIMAVRAFAPGQPVAAQGTSEHIRRGLEWSIGQGARVINMSFAGPRDPLMLQAIKAAADRRIVLIAAMGNEGPNAPVSFPAADPNVIAVTATDQNGRLFDAASRGRHVSVAAPGVEILLPAPRGGYQISSGTSVAAAHVSGIAALLLERQPNLDPVQLREIIRQTARHGAVRDPQLGAGLADPVPALNAAAPQAAPSVPMVTAPPPAPVPDTAQAPVAPPGADTAQAPQQAPRQATVDPPRVQQQSDPSKIETKN